MMKYYVKEIERIIQDIKPKSSEDLELDKFACLLKWHEDFFRKVKRNLKIKPQDFHSFYRRLREFKEKTDCSEEQFKLYYPNLEYEKYICPWDYKIMKVSEKKYHKMAFELQNHLKLEFNQLVILIKDLHRSYEKPNFSNLITFVARYDKNLYKDLLIYESFLEVKKEKAS